MNKLDIRTAALACASHLKLTAYSLTLLLLLASHLTPCTLRAQERPTVAVVLSGGGAKGVAHISALKAIEEAGIPVDIVCGTSMGSLIGALYSIGYSTDFLDSLVRNQDWTYLLSDRTDPSTLSLQERSEQNTYALIRGLNPARNEKGGLIRGRNLMRLFRQLCTGYLDSISFDRLPIRFACVATDIVTNTEVDFRSGYLTTAMRASMAIPGVFTPVRMGDSVLVDGGLANNLPVDLARKMGADVIISVTVQEDLATADDLVDAVSVLNQILNLQSKNKYFDNWDDSDVQIKVDVRGFSAASFTASAIDSLLRRGAKAAADKRDELQQLSAKLHHTPEVFTSKSKRSTMPDSSTDGVATRRWRPARHALKSDIPITSVGFRFDTEEMGVIQLDQKIPVKLGIPMTLEATIRLGRMIMAKAEATMLPKSFTSPSFNYTFRRNDIDVYQKGSRTYNARYRMHSVDVSPINCVVKNFIMKVGVKWDYYDFYGGVLRVADTVQLPTLANEHYFTYHASADLNNEDNWYFPHRGTRLHLAYACYTDNFVGYRDGLGINEINAHWRVNIPIKKRLTLQPMVYGRIVMTDDVPPVLRNTVGNEWFGHYLDQQMPFVGIGNVEIMKSHFVALQLQGQYRVANNQYILMRMAMAQNGTNLDGLFSDSWIMGLQAGYSYNTMFGPIDLRVGYCSYTRKPNVYINIGHCF